MSFINGVIDWLVFFVKAIIESTTQIITLSPLIGIALISLIALFLYWIFAVGVDFSSKALRFVVLVIGAVVILVIGYIMWTEYGIGGSIAEWLVTIFSGFLGGG